MNHTHQPTRRRRSALAACAAAGLALTACGGSDDSNSATPEVVIDGVADAADADDVTSDGDASVVTSDLSDEELALQFAQCMRDEGVDWPDPVTNADGSIDLFGGLGPGGAAGVGGAGGNEVTQAAAEVCGPLIEGASFLPGGGQIDADTQDTLLEFAQCLRDNGLDVDDPDISSLGPGGGDAGLFGDAFDPGDPGSQEAIGECQALFAGGFGPGGASGEGGE
ncbi:MAG: hypothetical protein AAGF73_10470 [Actinomycetota bacterium]